MTPLAPLLNRTAAGVEINSVGIHFWGPGDPGAVIELVNEEVADGVTHVIMDSILKGLFLDRFSVLGDLGVGITS